MITEIHPSTKNSIILLTLQQLMVHVLRKASMGATVWKTLLSESSCVTVSLPFCLPCMYRVSIGKKGGTGSSTTIITVNNIHNIQRNGTEREKTGAQLNWMGEKLVEWSGSGRTVACPEIAAEWRTAEVCPETCPLQHLYQ